MVNVYLAFNYTFLYCCLSILMEGAKKLEKSRVCLNFYPVSPMIKCISSIVPNSVVVAFCDFIAESPKIYFRLTLKINCFL